MNEIKSTIAAKPSKDLIDMGYSNSRSGHYEGVDEKKLFSMRRDYLLDNLFISHYCREVFDADEDYTIYVISAFGGTFISLEFSHWNYPDRIAADGDGEVNVSSGNDGDFFTPCVDIKDGAWEHHDDELWCAGFIDIDKDGYYVAGGSHHHWTTCMCIPSVIKYNVGKATLDMIVKKFNL